MLVSLQAVVLEEREGEGWQVHACFNVGRGSVGEEGRGRGGWFLLASM